MEVGTILKEPRDDLRTRFFHGFFDHVPKPFPPLHKNHCPGPQLRGPSMVITVGESQSDVLGCALEKVEAEFIPCLDLGIEGCKQRLHICITDVQSCG